METEKNDLKVLDSTEKAVFMGENTLTIICSACNRMIYLEPEKPGWKTQAVTCGNCGKLVIVPNPEKPFNYDKAELEYLIGRRKEIRNEMAELRIELVRINHAIRNHPEVVKQHKANIEKIKAIVKARCQK